MKTRVAIHGFGRIGRQALKAIWQQQPDSMEIAAVGLHELEDAAAAAHLLKHDSNYGRFAPPVAVRGTDLCIGDACIPLVAADRLADLPWADLGVDLVIEATGAYDQGRAAEGHLQAGARKVVVTTACDGADLTMIYGVNEDAYDPARHHLVAVDTETTNALAVVLGPLVAQFDIRGVLVSAVRAYNNQQKLIDTTDLDLRRARSAPRSIVPTTSRAARAVGQFVPALAGKVAGFAVRVPVPVVSMIELTIHLGEPATPEVLNDCLVRAAGGPLGRVLATSREPLVSSDYRGCAYSAVVDLPLTIAIGPLAKVSAWYDNEWGYSCRVADVAAVVARGAHR
jgi:glyceraldehyde 3-phosphate dehydrogenase